MAERGYRANKVVSRHVDDYVEQFDARILEDWMHTIDDGDDLVTHYAEAVANAEYGRDEADERYGWRDDVARTGDRVADELEGALADHLDALVAERCATVAQREGNWMEHHDDDAVEAAVHEARQWLQANREAAERAGVWAEVVA